MIIDGRQLYVEDTGETVFKKTKKKTYVPL